MRGVKSTIALLVILIGLGAYIYFVTWKQSDEGSGPKQEKVFTALDAQTIEELKIKAEAGDVTTVKKTGDKWEIVEPVEADASIGDIEGVTSALSSLELERVIEEDPTDLKTYGLDAPRIEVDFKADQGKKSGRLIVGNKTPTGASMYARRDDEKKVFLIPEFQDRSINKTTFDLRDKIVMRLDRENIDAFEIHAVNAPGHPLVLTRTGDEWSLTRPLKARADSIAVRTLIDGFGTVQMQSIAAASPTPADLKKFGLAPPVATVTFHVDKERFTLAVGGKASDETIYVRNMSFPSVVIVEKSVADDVKKSADDLRPKEVFASTAFNTTRAEFTRVGQTVVFEKVKGQGEGAEETWRRVSPNPAAADKTKMETLLLALADLRATSFVASTAGAGLGSPALTVFVKYDEGKKEERVSFGKSGANVFALVPGQPGAAKVDAQKFTDANKTLDELSK